MVAFSASARARAGPSKASCMTDMTCGDIAAADAPWARRATISASADQASPQASDDSVKPARPSRNSLRCPWSAPRRAPTISSVA